MKLYELPESLAALNDLVEEEAIDENGLQMAIDLLGEQVEQKMDGVVRLVRNWEAEADAIDAEVRRLRGRSTALRNQSKRLREYAINCLRAANRYKVVLPIATAYIGKSEAVEISVPPEALPTQYVKVVLEPDKMGIKQALKGGEVIEGAALVQKEYLVLTQGRELVKEE